MRVLIVFALLLGFGSADVSTNGCPQRLQQDQYLQVYGGYCFKFHVSSTLDYQDARKTCQTDGGDLAMPKVSWLNTWLASQLQTTYKVSRDVWIGLTDLDEESKFVWEDGTPMTWHKFAKGNGPTNDIFTKGLEDCVTIRPRDATWHDYHCKSELFGLIDESKPWVCQYPYTQPSTTAWNPPTTQGCGVLTCTKTCGLGGFKVDSVTNCLICECNDE